MGFARVAAAIEEAAETTDGAPAADAAGATVPPPDVLGTLADESLAASTGGGAEAGGAEANPAGEVAGAALSGEVHAGDDAAAAGALSASAPESASADATGREGGAQAGAGAGAGEAQTAKPEVVAEAEGVDLNARPAASLDSLTGEPPAAPHVLDDSLAAV